MAVAATRARSSRPKPEPPPLALVLSHMCDMNTATGPDASTEPTDADLVALARDEGDPSRAFDQLVARYRRRIEGRCRRMVGNDAEDMTQEILLKIYQALPRFEGRSTFETWTNRIQKNHCLNHIERYRKTVTVCYDDVVDELDIEEAELGDRDTRRLHHRHEIATILERVSPVLRSPLLLRDGGGFSYQEIAESEGIGLSAVKMRIKRGRAEFRHHWHEETAARAA